jgi:hypothetical protein
MSWGKASDEAETFPKYVHETVLAVLRAQRKKKGLIEDSFFSEMSNDEIWNMIAYLNNWLLTTWLFLRKRQDFSDKDVTSAIHELLKIVEYRISAGTWTADLRLRNGAPAADHWTDRIQKIPVGSKNPSQLIKGNNYGNVVDTIALWCSFGSLATPIMLCSVQFVCFLYTGKWPAYSCLDLIRDLGFQSNSWVADPIAWIGIHKLLSNTNAGLLIFLGMAATAAALLLVFRDDN